MAAGHFFPANHLPISSCNARKLAPGGSIPPLPPLCCNFPKYLNGDLLPPLKSSGESPAPAIMPSPSFPSAAPFFSKASTTPLRLPLSNATSATEDFSKLSPHASIASLNSSEKSCPPNLIISPFTFHELPLSTASREYSISQSSNFLLSGVSRLENILSTALARTLSLSSSTL